MHLLSCITYICINKYFDIYLTNDIQTAGKIKNSSRDVFRSLFSAQTMAKKKKEKKMYKFLLCQREDLGTEDVSLTLNKIFFV